MKEPEEGFAAILMLDYFALTLCSEHRKGPNHPAFPNWKEVTKRGQLTTEVQDNDNEPSLLLVDKSNKQI